MGRHFDWVAFLIVLGIFFSSVMIVIFPIWFNQNFGSVHCGYRVYNNPMYGCLPNDAQMDWVQGFILLGNILLPICGYIELFIMGLVCLYVVFNFVFPKD